MDVCIMATSHIPFPCQLMHAPLQHGPVTKSSVQVPLLMRGDAGYFLLPGTAEVCWLPQQHPWEQCIPGWCAWSQNGSSPLASRWCLRPEPLSADFIIQNSCRDTSVVCGMVMWILSAQNASFFMRHLAFL